MGKIFDALKKAEKDRQLFREQSQLVSAENTKSLQPRTEIKKAVQQTSNDPSTGSIIVHKEIKSQLNTELTLIPERPISGKRVNKKNSFLNMFRWKKTIVDQPEQADKSTINETAPFFVDHFRQLKTRISSFCQEKNIRTVLIASSVSGEGKSMPSESNSVSSSTHRGRSLKSSNSR